MTSTAVSLQILRGPIKGIGRQSEKPRRIVRRSLLHKGSHRGFIGGSAHRRHRTIPIEERITPEPQHGIPNEVHLLPRRGAQVTLDSLDTRAHHRLSPALRISVMTLAAGAIGDPSVSGISIEVSRPTLRD
jgi:hypothetical protein